MNKSLSDTSLSLLIKKEEFLTSKLTQWNKSTDIVLESLAKNVTENRAFRRKKSKQQRQVNIDTGKDTDSDKMLLTYADRVKKSIEQIVDFSQIYWDLLAGENRSSKTDTASPKLCTNSAHILNDPGRPNGEKNNPLFLHAR